MKRHIISAVLVGAGILVAFPLFSMTYYTMVRTSTPKFCASSHEIKPAVMAWRASTHTNNAVGVVVDCMDCHLPAPHRTFDFFFSKTYHGAKDVVKHFLIDEYDREKNRQAAYAGHFSLNLKGEDAMGPIQVRVEGDVQAVISYLS